MSDNRLYGCSPFTQFALFISHDKNIHDSKTLDAAITHANSNRTKPIQQAVCDRGYVGVKEVLGAMIIPPKKALKRDNRYQRDKKRLGILQKINPVFAKTKK
jgi:hypothetical protein